MEKEIKKISDVREEISIKLTKDEMQKFYDQAYEKARKDIALPGFRKGKVPLNLIKQRFGKEIEESANEEAVNEIFFDISKKEKINFIGEPVLKDIKDSDTHIEFIVEYDKLPEFELIDYKGIQIKEPVHNVTDEEVEETINKILLNNGNFVPDEIVSDEQYVVGVKIREVDASTGLPIVGAKEEDTHIYLAGEVVIPEFKSLIIGKRIGDSVIYRPKEQDKFAPDKTYSITINEIQKLVPAELNDEFVRLATNGKLESVEDYREQIAMRLQDEWNEKSRELMEKQIINYLVSNHNFEIPETLTWQVINAMIKDLREKYKNQKDQEYFSSPEIIRDLRPIAEHTVKWEIIRKKIIDAEGIKVEDYDIDPIVESESQRINADPEFLRNRLMQNSDFLNSILAKKVMDLLLDFAITEEADFSEFEPHDHDGHHHNHDEENHHHHDHDDEHRH